MATQFCDLLKGVIPSSHRWKMKLFRKWDEIIGDLKDKVSIECINNNVLVLGVSHPAWAQELYFLSDTIKSKINEALQEERIKDIRFKTVVSQKKNKKNVAPRKKTPSSKKDLKKVTLSDQESVCLGQVKDDGLRGALLMYYAQRFVGSPEVARKK